MKLFIWTDHYSYLVVAHGKTVKEARAALLEEIGTTDDTCSNRARVIQLIQSINPTICNGVRAEFAISEGVHEGLPEVTHYS